MKIPMKIPMEVPMRVPMKALWLSLLLAAPAHAFEAVSVGDGGSREVVFESRGVHPVVGQVRAGGDAIEVDVPPFGKASILLQCLGTPPPLVGLMGPTEATISPTSLSFPDGPPALWISREKAGRATLEARLRTVRPGLVLHHLTTGEVPERFAALRFAPVILVELSEWAELTPTRREAIRGAVAAGALLVLGGGEGPVDAAAVEALLPVRPGGVERAGPALTLAVERASGHRVLIPAAGATVRVVADGAPVVVEAPLGLGQVRVVAVRLGELDEGPVEAAAFGDIPDALGTVLAWLQAAEPLGAARATPLAAHTWYLLLALLGLAVIARRLPRVAVGAALALAAVACVLPPTRVEVTALAARMLYLPAGQGALVVGTLDVELQRGGAYALDARVPRISLDEARPGGACAIVAPTQAAWALAGEPGARRRLTTFALIDTLPTAGPPAGELPAWPAGPLAGATLHEATAPTLPLALAPARLEARVAGRSAEAASAPVVLPAPPEG